MGASHYGQFKFLLPEFSQMIFSPGPLIYKLRQGLKNYKVKDYLLLTGDPAIIGVACSIVSDITHGKYNVLKWDKQERKYYPIDINLYEKGEIDDSINFEQDKTDILDKSENIKSLSNEVQKMESLAKEIEDIEENLKDKKKDLDVISAEVIPTMMSEMGLSQLKLMDGSMIDVKPFYNATITVANRESAFNWLRQNGLEDIIKNEMVVSFGRGEDNKAAEYAELAKSQGLQPAQKLKVEPMTLKALVRQRIEAGQEMPTEIFSIFVGNKTTIKRKK